MLLALCSALSLLTASSRVQGQQTVDVTTPDGVLRGTRVSLGDNNYIDRFYKIPYARPPVGNLRFREPMVNEGWSDVRDATQQGPQCPQRYMYEAVPSNIQYRDDEDCLYLNVYTPKPTGGPMPVMVWIHGGGYYAGSGVRYDGTPLAARGVVYVSINYRLDALGFLSTEDAASPGNYGLLDQIRALEWVRDSISAFHGDPGNVTIFGESAGSTSVSLLVLSRSARGLFNKAIMQSGVSTSPWAVGLPHVHPSPHDNAVALAKRVECTIADNSAMVACLRTKDANVIINASAATSLETQSLRFRPVPETTFGQYGMFVATPLAILENGWFSNVTAIRGFNKDEFVNSNIDPENNGLTLEEFKARLHDFVSSNFAHASLLAPVNTDRIQTLLLDAYVTQPRITAPIDLRAALIQMQNDFTFIAPTLQELKLMTKFQVKPQYLYRFSHRSTNRRNPEWTGVVHADDLLYVFGLPLSNDTRVPNFVSAWTVDDVRVSNDIVTMWTNFAKYGDPTPAQSIDGVRWQPFTPERPFFLNIVDHIQLNPFHSLSDAQYTLWTDTIPKIVHGEDIIG